MAAARWPLSSTQTSLNGEHAVIPVIHKPLRFYTLKMSDDIVTLPELLLPSPSSFICLSCRGVGQLFFDTSSVRLHFLFLCESNLQTQPFAFPVK